jgi:hypothetical protein
MKQIVNLVMTELGFALIPMELHSDMATILFGKLVHTEIGGQIQSKKMECPTLYSQSLVKQW